MKRFLFRGGFALPALALLAAPAFAQPEGTAAPDDGLSHPPTLSEWGDDLDRPLARALAFDRRDVVEEILLRPGSLGAATPAELAREASIPLRHAEVIVEGVRGSGAETVRKVETLLRLGVPEGFSPSNLKLATASQAALIEAGMTEAEARSFIRYRNSAKRAHLHFREVRAIQEARTRGAELAAERAVAYREASPRERVRMIAERLGLATARSGSASSVRVERANVRARVMGSSAEYAGRDALATFRRADGTVNWGRLTTSETFRGASGLAHFGFALFLKELALVLHTGDRARMEEFVDHLMTTDFFINYGLFAAGARAADVAYGRYVRRLTRKRFLSGVMRTNLVLAAGLAVPMIARGQFDLATYVVDVAALGLSATAVKAAVEGTKGIYKLVRGGRSALNLGRLAGPVGWVYSAGETAVVLLLGDYLAARFDEYASERALEERLESAEEALNLLLKKTKSGQPVSDREMISALDELQDAYDAKRRYATRPLDASLRNFQEDLDDAGRESMRDDVEVDALEERLANSPALREHFASRHGSVEDFLERMRRSREARVEALLRDASAEHEAAFEPTLREVYEGGPRTEDDPAPAEGSRLALYDEETTLLLRALDGTTNPEARHHIAMAIERVRLARAMDRDVYESGLDDAPPAPDATPPAPRESEGMTGAVPASDER
jgi:hypothetical protein